MITLTHKFAAYVDWTLEDQPRPFYVGKGNQDRVNERVRRNRYYINIAKKYGVQRRVVMENDDENVVFAMETQLIQEHKTYVYGGPEFWGANMTLGGEGRSGSYPDASTRFQMSQSQKIAWQDEGRKARASITQRARLADSETRQIASQKYIEVWSDPELRNRMSETLKQTCSKPDVKKRMSDGQRNVWTTMTPRQREKRCKSASEAARKREAKKRGEI